VDIAGEGGDGGLGWGVGGERLRRRGGECVWAFGVDCGVGWGSKPTRYDEGGRGVGVWDTWKVVGACGS